MHAASLSLYLLSSILPSRISFQILHQDFSGGLVLLPDEAQSQEEASEGVFLILHNLLLCGDALAVSGHICQCADELHVGFCLSVFLGQCKPRESDALFIDLVGKVVSTKCLAEQMAFGYNDAVQIGKGSFIHGIGRNLHRQLVVLLLWFRFLRFLRLLWRFCCQLLRYLLLLPEAANLVAAFVYDTLKLPEKSVKNP